MVGNMQPRCYVRAKPRKISLTETYYYKAEIQDSTNFQFEKADGEIKVEFIYDGERRDGRWKIGQFLESLSRQFELLHGLERTLRWLFRLRLIAWIVGVTGLAWLWKKLVRLLLGQPPGDRFFGIAAIQDAAKCGQGCPTARAGHLVLYGYESSNFTQGWPRQQIIPLEVSLQDLKHNLERTQQSSLSYKYAPKGPPVMPLHPPTVKLSDVGWDRYAARRHLSFDEALDFSISLTLDASQPKVDERDELPKKVVEGWWRELRQEKPKKGETPKQNRQVQLLDNLEELKAALYDLATHRGGYILLHTKELNGDPKAALRQLKRHLLGISLTRDLNRVFVPLLPPYCQHIEGQAIYVIPVPMVPPRWYETGRIWDEEMPQKNRLRIEGMDRAPDKVITIGSEGKNENDVKRELAIALATLANSQGGSVLLKAAEGRTLDYSDIYPKYIRPARFLCWPPLSLHFMRWFPYQGTNQGKGNTIVEIESTSPEVHSVDKAVYLWQNGQALKLLQEESDEDLERIYRLMKDRCIPDHPTVEPLPVVFYADVHGPHFDARDYHGSTYNREDEALKWTNEAVFELGKDHAYQATLTFVLNRPVELYKQEDLSGDVHIDLKERLLSGIEVGVFDATGNQVKAGDIVEKKSRLKITFNHITLRQVFKRREFSARRELEFEGVRLDDQRLDDIQSMLADLGLEYITSEMVESRSARYTETSTEAASERPEDYLISAERSDGLWIEIDITGKSHDFARERKEGERTERMRLESGHLHITIRGGIEGELHVAQDLSRLMNDLQRLLKERFSYVRAQVA